MEEEVWSERVKENSWEGEEEDEGGEAGAVFGNGFNLSSSCLLKVSRAISLVFSS